MKTWKLTSLWVMRLLKKVITIDSRTLDTCGPNQVDLSHFNPPLISLSIPIRNTIDFRSHHHQPNHSHHDHSWIAWNNNCPPQLPPSLHVKPSPLHLYVIHVKGSSGLRQSVKPVTLPFSLSWLNQCVNHADADGIWMNVYNYILYYV